jgi:mono/diheme cytochrome c family protein
VAVALLAMLALVPTAASHARGTLFSAPQRVPQAHDTDIGMDSSGDAAIDYALHCQGCHQAGGDGLAGEIPALRDSVARFVVLDGGREYLGRVPGVAQSALDDAAMAKLLNWILEYFDAAHLPADFEPFTAAELGPLRRRPLVGASKVRAALLESANGEAPARRD